MFVSRVVQRLTELPVNRRALAINALARATLYSDLDHEDRRLAQDALIRALDDPSCLVRRALAKGVAEAEDAPRTIIHLLANDQFQVSEPVLRFSPVLSDAQLIDLAAIGELQVQKAIAERPFVSVSVAAAIGEVGEAEACLSLLKNAGANILEDTVRAIAERFSDHSGIRSELLSWDDLPIDIRHDLMHGLGDSLRTLISQRNWMGQKRVESVIGEATEKATLRLFEEECPADAAALTIHLHEAGKLTTRLLMRAAVTGNMVVLETGLSLLSGQDRGRIFAILVRGGAGARSALFEAASILKSAWPVFDLAIRVYRELDREPQTDDYRSFRQTMIERILTHYEALPEEQSDKVLALLHRYAADAARDRARLSETERRLPELKAPLAA